MKPVVFPGHNTVYAKDQPEYLPLPVYKRPGAEGEVTSCWKMSFRERIKVLFTGKVYWSQWTFGGKLQPQRATVDNPVITKDIIKWVKSVLKTPNKYQ